MPVDNCSILWYVRCSTAEQNEARQAEALEKNGIERWYTEKISDKDTNRPKLQEMLDYVRDGDTIYIHDLSRLARSTADLLVIGDLLNKRVFTWYTRKLLFSYSGTKQDTG